jgi:DNA-binding CsgD family transcriptional regulator
MGLLISEVKSIKPEVLIRYYFIVMNVVYSSAAALLILFPKSSRAFIHTYDSRKIATGIFAVMFLQCIPLFFYTISVFIGLAFILVFFIGYVFLPVYFTYGTMVSSFAEETGKELSFDDFCRKYDVSPRETDIIREICNGLSNKEIADKLFISLQTVKDHTHRIYIKTNVRSRVQLINLVKEETKQ